VALEAILVPLRGRYIQDPASELPRISIPRTPVNRGKKKDRADMGSGPSPSTDNSLGGR
jgi:hypothetical protein